MNKLLVFIIVGIVILLLGVSSWNSAQPPIRKAQFSDPAVNRICHRYITKQSTFMPHLAITKFTNTNGETGGYADLSFSKDELFEGVIFDKDGHEINLGIPYGTASLDARKDLTVKANEQLKKLKDTHQTETVTWCDGEEGR